MMRILGISPQIHTLRGQPLTASLVQVLTIILLMTNPVTPRQMVFLTDLGSKGVSRARTGSVFDGRNR